MCVLVGMGWLVCVYMASFPSSWLHSGLGVYGNGSIGCTNNNYASREKCKKCGQPKEVAAMPAIAMPGASLPTYSHYFARAQGGQEQKMNFGLIGNGAPQQSLPLRVGIRSEKSQKREGVREKREGLKREGRRERM